MTFLRSEASRRPVTVATSTTSSSPEGDDPKAGSGEFVEDQPPDAAGATVVTKSIEQSRETTRAWLAGALTALLAIVVILIPVGAMFFSYPAQDAQDLLSLLLAPLVGLVAAATGFYYGQHKP